MSFSFFFFLPFFNSQQHVALNRFSLILTKPFWKGLIVKLHLGGAKDESQIFKSRHNLQQDFHTTVTFSKSVYIS